MIVVEVESFCLADPLFYDTESRWDDERTTYRQAREPAPDGWVRGERDVWVVLTPQGHDVPPQGWKIHVSARVENGEKILDVVHRYCVERRVPFKFLRGRNVLRAHNLKYADRSYSGKLVTIYPDPDQLGAMLGELSAELAGETGPYILTDLRWGDGPLYVRYGSFVDRYCHDEDGYLVPAIQRPDGTLVPDHRRPVFSVPDWVVIPEFLGPHLAARNQPPPEDFPYQVESALHFSNGGGVYQARRTTDGLQVVLKEARPHAGLDGHGDDAITRLRRERDALRRLAGIEGVPAVYGYHAVWEHEFLVQEHKAGETLFSWQAINYPLVRARATPDDIAAFLLRAASVANQIERIVSEIHDRGMVVADLHPNNILVDEGDRVAIIDLETAIEAEAYRGQGIGLPGFRAPGGDGRDADRYALAAIRLCLLMPMLQIAELAPGKLRHLHDEAVARLSPPTDYLEAISTELFRRWPDGGRTGMGEVARLDTDWAATQQSIAAAILLSATPERSDRLFPGDVRQFAVEAGGITLGYGAAGVLWALRQAGAGRYPEHEDWLVTAVKRTPLPRAGLYDGMWGLAFTLDELDHQDQAWSLLDRAVDATRRLEDVTLESGLAGCGLAALHFARRHGEPAFLDTVRVVAERLEAAVHSDRPYGIDSTPMPRTGRGVPNRGSRAGLLRGWSGVGLWFLRLYEHTGEAAYLDLAIKALHRDLELCRRGPDGSLQVHDGFRLLPYLQVGSAGIALVAGQVLGHRDDTCLQESLPSLIAALCPEFVVESQLANGRAGLLATLSSLGGQPGLVDEDWIRLHLRRLHWHAVPYRGHVAFPGSGLRRLSMDLLTGGSGVLLAIRAAVDEQTAFLPFLGGCRQERR